MNWKMLLATAGSISALLAGCGSGGDDGAAGNRQVKQISVANPYHKQLLELDERYRRVALLRAVRDTGNPCRSVVGANHQQEHERLQMWVAHCDNGREWAVFLGPAGQVQVRDCREAAQLGLPQCRPFEPAPMEPLPPVANTQN